MKHETAISILENELQKRLDEYKHFSDMRRMITGDDPASEGSRASWNDLKKQASLEVQELELSIKTLRGE